MCQCKRAVTTATTAIPATRTTATMPAAAAHGLPSLRAHRQQSGGHATGPVPAQPPTPTPSPSAARRLPSLHLPSASSAFSCRSRSVALRRCLGQASMPQRLAARSMACGPGRWQLMAPAACVLPQQPATPLCRRVLGTQECVLPSKGQQTVQARMVPPRRLPMYARGLWWQTPACPRSPPSILCAAWGTRSEAKRKLARAELRLQLQHGSCFHRTGCSLPARTSKAQARLLAVPLSHKCSYTVRGLMLTRTLLQSVINLIIRQPVPVVTAIRGRTSRSIPV